MAYYGGIVFSVIGCLAIFSKPVLADRIREKIYYDFTTHASCVRRLNGTHEIGCSSSQLGDVGVLHYVRSELDVQYVTKNGPHAPYTAIINILDLSFYNVKMLRRLQDSRRIRGVVLIKYDNETMTTPDSPDNTCPNSGYGLYDDGVSASCGGIPWNAAGNGMLYQRWDFPIFLLYQNADIDYLLDNCVFRFNQPEVNQTVASWPLCSAELKSFMLAAADSQTCIRRSNTITNLSPQTRCDPLADSNVFASLNPVNKSTSIAPNSTIIIAARLDASGVFDGDFVHGVESSVSGLVTLLLVADTLAKVRKDLADKNIVFIVFNGEAFDYIGSSRVVYDMQLGEFPQKLDPAVFTQNAAIRLEDIDFFLELSQLGLLRDSTFYLHSDPLSVNDTRVQESVGLFSRLAAGAATSLGMKAVLLSGTQQLPPASFQQFLKSGLKIPGLVVADHQREYQNKFYNSIFDDLKGQNSFYPENMTDADAYNYPSPIAVNAQKIATVMARSLYKLVTGRDHAQPLEASLNTSANLMYCYSYKSYCPMFAEYFNGTATSKLQNSSVDLYIGANRYESTPQRPASLTARVLGNFVGERVNLTEEACLNSKTDQMNNFVFYFTFFANDTREGYCVKSNAGFSRAESPAFLVDDYSGKYSTWTESVWVPTSIRIFLKPDPQEDINTLAFGTVATIVISGLILFMSHKAGDIFVASEEV